MGVGDEASRDPAALASRKGFGGGEVTRDPAPTYIDPNDPKAKQQAIPKVETFAEYLARRTATLSTASIIDDTAVKFQRADVAVQRLNSPGDLGKEELTRGADDGN